MELVFLLVLIPAISAQGTDVTSKSSPSPPIQESKTMKHTSTPTPIKPTITPMKPISTTMKPIIHIQQNLGTVRVKWEKTKPCQGSMVFSWNFTEQPASLFFKTASTKAQVAGKMCEDRGCGKLLGFPTSGHFETDCYIVEENLTVTPGKCKRELINCEVKASKELVVYKSITGLLLALILAVILLRYARPAYEAFHKRFSKKRQNRWIGPTQSQSVSYHRGQQAGNPSDNTVKRQSFPGLERLTVNSSREPSSNRNSDYDSYGFN